MKADNPNGVADCSGDYRGPPRVNATAVEQQAGEPLGVFAHDAVEGLEFWNDRGRAPDPTQKCLAATRSGRRLLIGSDQGRARPRKDGDDDIYTYIHGDHIK